MFGFIYNIGGLEINLKTFLNEPSEEIDALGKKYYRSTHLYVTQRLGKLLLVHVKEVKKHNEIVKSLGLISSLDEKCKTIVDGGNCYLKEGVLILDESSIMYGSPPIDIAKNYAELIMENLNLAHPGLVKNILANPQEEHLSEEHEDLPRYMHLKNPIPYHFTSQLQRQA